MRLHHNIKLVCFRLNLNFQEPAIAWFCLVPDINSSTPSRYSLHLNDITIGIPIGGQSFFFRIVREEVYHPIILTVTYYPIPIQLLGIKYYLLIDNVLLS
jgi:hypothetical protein